MPRFALISCILVLLAPAAYYAPTFLLVADQPVKSDAVVLFLGGERGTREKEARQLLKEGWAGYLIIPARSQVQKLGPDGKLIRIDLTLPASSSNQGTNKLTNQQTSSLNTRDSGRTNEPTNQRTSSNSPPNQPTNEQTKLRNWVVEDTHQEALITRDLMERLGLRSAILVSSPYHMRRIRLISGKTFAENMVTRYVPTRYETPNETFWLLNSYDRRFVLTEYMKIGWFLLYSPFI